VRFTYSCIHSTLGSHRSTVTTAAIPRTLSSDRPTRRTNDRNNLQRFPFSPRGLWTESTPCSSDLASPTTRLGVAVRRGLIYGPLRSVLVERIRVGGRFDHRASRRSLTVIRCRLTKADLTDGTEQHRKRSLIMLTARSLVTG